MAWMCASHDIVARVIPLLGKKILKIETWLVPDFFPLGGFVPGLCV